MNTNNRHFILGLIHGLQFWYMTKKIVLKSVFKTVSSEPRPPYTHKSVLLFSASVKFFFLFSFLFFATFCGVSSGKICRSQSPYDFDLKDLAPMLAQPPKRWQRCKRFIGKLLPITLSIKWQNIYEHSLPISLNTYVVSIRSDFDSHLQPELKALVQNYQYFITLLLVRNKAPSQLVAITCQFYIHF